MRKRQARYIQSASWAAVVLLCVLAASSRAQAATIPLTGGGQKGAMHKQVEKLEEQWRAAVLAGDTAVMSSLLADSYVGIGPDGTIAGKAQELQARSSGQDHVQRFDVEDRNIRLYGATAVVTSRVRVEGVYSGQPLLGEYRYTRVWTLSHGQWRIVSFEANRVHDVSERRK